MLPSRLRVPFERVSEHIVYSSALYADLRSRVIRMEAAMIDFSLPSRSEADHRAHRAAQLLRPYAIGLPLLRVGGSGDGGYVMADAFTTPRAISVGVGPDVSWDADIAGRGIAVIMFDPTVDGPPHEVPGSTFHAVGLGTVEQAASSGLRLQPFDELLSTVSSDFEDTILKIDIEGAEWEALADVEDFSRFPQLLMELHDLGRLADESRGANVLRVLETLFRMHVPVHLHGNNEVPVVPIDRYWLPGALEATWVRRDLAVGATPAHRLQTHLDAPSNDRFADLDLRGMLTANPA